MRQERASEQVLLVRAEDQPESRTEVHLLAVCEKPIPDMLTPEQDQQLREQCRKEAEERMIDNMYLAPLLFDFKNPHNQQALQQAYADALYSERKRTMAIEQDRDNLRAYVERLIRTESWMQDEYLDGGTVQDEAERMGILVQVQHTMPCENDNCGCEGEEVDHLYNFAWKVNDQNDQG